jgi:hypothetical protein
MKIILKPIDSNHPNSVSFSLIHEIHIFKAYVYQFCRCLLPKFNFFFFWLYVQKLLQEQNYTIRELKTEVFTFQQEIEVQE